MGEVVEVSKGIVQRGWFVRGFRPHTESRRSSCRTIPGSRTNLATSSDFA
jgi:hypothetical protein